MSIIKIFLFILFILFILGLVRIVLALFKFSAFMKKVGGAGREKVKTRKEAAPAERSYSRDKKTITLGKDDYHVE